MSKPTLEELGKAFTDLATDYNTWNVDYSLSLFRKKLKIAGEKISEWFKFLDEYINQKVQEIIAEMNGKNDALKGELTTGLTDLDTKLTDTNTAIEAKFKIIDDELRKNKVAHKVISDNIDILMANDRTMVAAINDIYSRLHVKETEVITEIQGGSALG